MIALIGGKLINGTGANPIENSAVLVEGRHIKDVCPKVHIAIGEGCEVIDISGKTILPGLMDLHVHLHIGESDRIVPSGGLPPELNQLLTYIGIKGFAHARRALDMGFTTLRDAGDVGYLSVALREAIQKDLVEGPRIVASGQWLSATGGHADYLPYWVKRIDDESNVADGPEGILKAVRRQIKMKTDWIKLYVTGGIMDPEDKQEFNDVELKTAIDEAHAKGKSVMGHCMYAEGALAGIKAGLDTIEHGTVLTEEVIELMLERGVSLIPTLTVGRSIVEHGAEFGLPEVYLERFKPVLEIGRRSFQNALAAGVNIAFGTDAGFNVMLHGENGKEFQTLVDYGMSPMQAIQTATIKAAQVLRMEDRLGTIEKGKLADIIVIDGDPLETVSVFQKQENFVLIMKEGVIYKRSL